MRSFQLKEVLYQSDRTKQIKDKVIYSNNQKLYNYENKYDLNDGCNLCMKDNIVIDENIVKLNYDFLIKMLSDGNYINYSTIKTLLVKVPIKRHTYNHYKVEYTFLNDSVTLSIHPNYIHNIVYLNYYLQQHMIDHGHYLLNESNHPIFFTKLFKQGKYTILEQTVVPNPLPIGWSYPKNWNKKNINYQSTTPILILPKNSIVSNTLGLTTGIFPFKPINNHILFYFN